MKQCIKTLKKVGVNKMRVLVTGGNGQLAAAISELESHFEFWFADKYALDITDARSVSEAFNKWLPDAVIHCAAYTNVEAAEKERESAYRINSFGTELIANACEMVKAKLIYISTDFVFDGNQKSPYKESDKPNPINYYGITKLLGEEIVRKNCEKHFILRTSWLYGAYGNNFVKTILKLAKKQKQIKVIYDQIGTPTNARDLANALLTIIETDQYGTYNYSNLGETSWYEFAKKVASFSNEDVEILPIKTSEFFSDVKRPSYSVLSKQLIMECFNLKIRDWESALEDYFRRV